MPVPTVAEVLKSAGMDDAAITALDKKVLAGFTGVLTAAEAELQKAELAQRSTAQLFDEQITPALNGWGNEKARLAAERDYYKTLADGAKDGGFIAAVPPFQPAVEIVPGGNAVPGSPDIRKALEDQIGNAMGTIVDLDWKYRQLHNGAIMPDPPTKLVAEATAQRMPVAEYVARKYNFAQKEQDIAAAKQKEHDDAIRKEERSLAEREFAEKRGSNGDIRQGVVSSYVELKKGVEDGTRLDPLKMTESQRRQATANAIAADVAAATIH